MVDQLKPTTVVRMIPNPGGYTSFVVHTKKHLLPITLPYLSCLDDTAARPTAGVPA
jgi:hypothetical protein